MGRREARRKGCCSRCRPPWCFAGTTSTPVINELLGERKPLLTSQHLPLSQPEPLTHARGLARAALPRQASSDSKLVVVPRGGKEENRESLHRLGRLSPTAGMQPARWDLPALGSPCPREGDGRVFSCPRTTSRKGEFPVSQCWNNQGNSDTDLSPLARGKPRLCSRIKHLNTRGEKPWHWLCSPGRSLAWGGGHRLTPTSTWSEPRSSCLWSSSK